MRLVLPDDLLDIVVRLAWPVPKDFVVTQQRVLDQLNCALDCQQNIPPWFLNDIQLSFSHKRLRLNEPLPLSHLKKFNPLVLGAAFSPFDPQEVRLNRRSLAWLFNSLTPAYLRRKKMLRKPLFRFLEIPVLQAWNRLLRKIQDVTWADTNPRGYMMSLITNAMITHLPCASPIGNWARRFSLS